MLKLQVVLWDNRFSVARNEPSMLGGALPLRLGAISFPLPGSLWPFKSIPKSSVAMLQDGELKAAASLSDGHFPPASETLSEHSVAILKE